VAQSKPARSQQERTARSTRINPSAKPQTVPTAPAVTRRESDTRLDQMLAEARSHQEQGDLFEAYRIAVIAQQFAERENIVFAPREQRPVDVIRDIERQMRASQSNAEDAPARSAPAVGLSHQPPAGPVAVPTSPPALAAAARARRTTDPFADMPRQAARPAVETAEGMSPAAAPESRGQFGSGFRALHEWRSVRANGPVSLAVGNAAPVAINELPERPVQQALATGDSSATPNRASLLARAEADRDRILAAGHGTSLFSNELRPPALAAASHPDLQPVGLPAPPPLNAAPRRSTIAAGTGGVGRNSGGGLVWWVLGGLGALTTAIAFKYRQQPARRR
jgi:hypothetical protein